LTARENQDDAAPVGSRASGPVCDRILVVITEDWFALSHFKPLLSQLSLLAREVVVATRSSGRLDELAALGVRPIAFDMQRGSFNPLKLAKVRRHLAALIDAERPDAVHAISLQPMLLASLATRAARHKPHALVLHVTGLGYIAASHTPRAWLARNLTFGMIRLATRHADVWLLAENPDDIIFTLARGVGRASRTTIVPGAGVDPIEFPALPPPANAVPRAAYVGRLVRSKGVDVLVAAHQKLRERGIGLDLALYGAIDTHNPDAVTRDTLTEWQQRPGLSAPGHVTDVRNVWREADIAVVPTLGGEGVPRAMLEAAACARPIVASDVSGCKHFLRDGVEGALVPPGDADRLAEALARLAADPELRRRQGAAARARLLAGYTTAAVQKAIRDAYAAMFPKRG
jgi:glycosyltransferase involved in cell wall biosynthesis